MKALVLGATGAVGKDLVNQLLAEDHFDRIELFVRRPVSVGSAKAAVHVVDCGPPGEWPGLLTGDVLFSCLGTTIKADRQGL